MSVERNLHSQDKEGSSKQRTIADLRARMTRAFIRMSEHDTCLHLGDAPMPSKHYYAAELEWKQCLGQLGQLMQKPLE